MADFCMRCNMELMFGPHSDFDWVKDHLTAEDDAKGIGIGVLCEGCGMTVVNSRGQCRGGCDAGHIPPGGDEVLRRAEEWLDRRSGPLGILYRLRDRLLGTPWEPGLRHQWRWHWYNFLDRCRNKPSDFDFDDFK